MDDSSTPIAAVVLFAFFGTLLMNSCIAADALRDTARAMERIATTMDPHRAAEGESGSK
jgi:hypothetical protein